jgi:hypothetical protein
MYDISDEEIPAQVHAPNHESGPRKVHNERQKLKPRNIEENQSQGGAGSKTQAAQSVNLEDRTSSCPQTMNLGQGRSIMKGKRRSQETL